MTTPGASDYSDRKTGLVLFGILEIAIGSVCGLMILLMMATQAAAGRNPNLPPRAFSLGPVIALYGTMGVAFVWLGIGSIMARRWARAILLCLSAVGLVGGCVACVSMAFILPHMFDAVAKQSPQALPPGAMMIAKVVAAVFGIIVYILIPGALFLFYRSPHVRLTCEARDPNERWTDRCPLPVLAFSMMMAAGGAMLLAMMTTRWHVFPFFGTFVGGGAGLSVSLVLGGLLLYLARETYRLQVRAWWIALGLQVAVATSSIVTFMRADVGEMYLKMGLEPRVAAMSAQLISTPPFKWLIVLSVLPWLVWLLCIRRYFDGSWAPAVLPAGEPPVLPPGEPPVLP